MIETSKRWTAARQRLGEYLEGLSPDLLDREAYRHPIAGRLTVEGMLSFYQEHFNRHRQQIMRTLAAVTAG